MTKAKDIPSIISKTGFWYDTEPHRHWTRHHMIFGSGGRRFSVKYGLWVYIPEAIHQTGKEAIHDSGFTVFDERLGKKVNPFDIFLRRLAQQSFEDLYGHEAWMHEWGENYL